MADTAWLESTAGEQVPVWDYKTDKELIGVYIEGRENVGPNNSKFYVFENKKGKIGVWGTSLLDSRMPTIPLGEEVKMEYLGKVKNPKTARMYHNFKIYHRPTSK